MRDKLKVLDLFSGIGGFSLGLERTGGFETISFCEIDSFCQNVLRKHWPNVIIHQDIKKLNGSDINADVITGGYPCQPFSSIGSGKGSKDPRHLWPEMFRVIKQVRPSWVIAENVERHIANGLDIVCNDLEGEGYAVRPIIIPACAVGSPQQRIRIWVVAYSESQRERRTLEASRCASIENEVRGGRANGEPLRTDSGTTKSGRAGHWESEPRVGRVVSGLPSRLDKNRIAALGNAVLPQIPEAIGETILKVMQ